MNDEDEKIQFTREWLVSAENDLEGVSRLLQPPPLSALAAFHCQQAVEKALKGYLMWNDTPFRKTHNLVELVKQCAEHDASFRELRSVAETLTPYATESRYPDTQLILTGDGLAEAERMASETLDFVRTRLPREVRP